LNLGCPQPAALKGGWGGALMDEENRHLVQAIVQRAASSPLLHVPMKCKIRIFSDDRKTLRFPKMIQDAGRSLLTVHFWRRCQELHHAPADWSAIRKVHEALAIPVVANGGVSSLQSALQCLEETGCPAVMVATALLADPEFFIQPVESADEAEVAVVSARLCKVGSLGGTPTMGSEGAKGPLAGTFDTGCQRHWRITGNQ